MGEDLGCPYLPGLKAKNDSPYISISYHSDWFFLVLIVGCVQVCMASKPNKRPSKYRPNEGGLTHDLVSMAD